MPARAMLVLAMTVATAACVSAPPPPAEPEALVGPDGLILYRAPDPGDVDAGELAPIGSDQAAELGENAES